MLLPIIAIVPFSLTIRAVRRTAPTDLPRVGAFAGPVAVGISALAYALHCTDDSLTFVADWHGGTIVLCTLAGAAQAAPAFVKPRVSRLHLGVSL